MTLVLRIQAVISPGADFDISVGQSPLGTPVAGKLTLSIEGAAREFALRIGSKVLPPAASQDITVGSVIVCTVTKWGDVPHNTTLTMNLSAAGSSTSDCGLVA